jgi:serine/threonine-protein kinase RsbW
VDKDAVAISVIEACTNAIQHGYHEDGVSEVDVLFEMAKDRLTITVHDRGSGFTPAKPDEATPPDLLATRGRGIFIMRSMMDEVEFDFSQGTQVKMVKHRSTENGKGGGGDPD